MILEKQQSNKNHKMQIANTPNIKKITHQQATNTSCPGMTPLKATETQSKLLEIKKTLEDKKKKKAKQEQIINKLNE